MCSGSEAGSYVRLIDSCITQLKAQLPSRTCNESKEEEVKKKAHDLLAWGRGARVSPIKRGVRGPACEVGIPRLQKWRAQ